MPSAVPVPAKADVIHACARKSIVAGCSGQFCTIKVHVKLEAHYLYIGLQLLFAACQLQCHTVVDHTV